MNYYVSFDIGGTKVKHGLLSENGDIIKKNSYDTQTQDSDLFIQSLVDTVHSYQQQVEIKGVAISFPGFINTQTGYVASAGAITALYETNLKTVLESRLLLPVAIENDANCVALAEKFLGRAKTCEDFICLTIGTGIGGGIVINNRIVHGHQWRAGEFGMMNMATTRCNYQNMHELSSMSALIAAYKTYKRIPEAEKIEGEVVFSEMANDPNVQELVNDWLKFLSYGIFNLACTLNPEKILIGGGVSQKEELIDMLKDALAEIPPWKDFEVPLERCHFKNDAGLIGALYHFLKGQIEAS